MSSTFAETKYDLPASLCTEIVLLAKKFNLKQLILFGSRARKDNHALSDIDLAVSGGDVTGFALAVDEETSTLLTFDVVNLDENISAELQAEINRDGINLYKSGVEEMKKYEAFASCLKVLEQADQDEASRSEIYRMGIIGQFNLTFELSWKALKEILTLYGIAEAATGSPREIFKAAYALGWLKNENVWLDMLKKRNIAIHVYDEKRALTVTTLIFTEYLAALQELREELHRRLTAK